MGKYRVLIVEDDAELRQTLSEVFERNEFEAEQSIDGLDALEKIAAARPDLVMLDVNMPRLNGLDCLARIKELDPSIIVIIMTAYSAIEDAVRAIKEGAYNYLAKPIKHQAVVEMVQRAIEAQKMVHNMAFSAPVVQFDGGEIVGSSSEMQKIYAIIHKLAKVDTAVLIRGESGTGKELVARAIHYNSARKDHKLVPINCSSIPETLFESELFGHERGSFTGADKRQIGRFQYAEGGTVFLDEIGDLSLAMQVKLLRVLQEKKFTPVGSNREIDMDVRIIAATNRNLEEMIKSGAFREDLFYRLNVIPIYLPPLTSRRGDIEKLIRHFIAKFVGIHNKDIIGIVPAAMEVLLNHKWPGNIRELENVVEHAIVIEGSNKITASSLPAYLTGYEPTPFFGAPSDEDGEDEELETAGGTVDPDLDYKRYKEKLEKEFIIKALKTFNGRINQTAMHANIPKKTLLRKLQKYAIRAEDYRT